MEPTKEHSDKWTVANTIHSFHWSESMNISEILEKKEDCDTWNETDYERSTVCKWMNTIDLVVDDFG